MSKPLMYLVYSCWSTMGQSTVLQCASFAPTLTQEVKLLLPISPKVMFQISHGIMHLVLYDKKVGLQFHFHLLFKSLTKLELAKHITLHTYNQCCLVCQQRWWCSYKVTSKVNFILTLNSWQRSYIWSKICFTDQLEHEKVFRVCIDLVIEKAKKKEGKY